MNANYRETVTQPNLETGRISDAICNVILVDDHVLLRRGLGELIRGFDRYNILFEAKNGKDFIDKLKPISVPAVVLMDINMPEMDGYQTANWIKANCPDLKVLALSMYDNENAIIRMFKAGARGYILKDSAPEDLNDAIHSVVTRGFYYSEMITGSLINTINKLDEDENQIRELVNLNDKEVLFLKLVCSEMNYSEIADEMCLSPRTIDGYRDKLFQKLNIKTRVGLAIYAIKKGIVTLW